MRCLNQKFLLNFCNFLFLLCGITLIISGFYLFTDSKRILLSRLLAAASDQLNDLPQPLFYYIAIGLAMAGLVAVLTAIVGFWATCLNTYCCLSVYFLAVVVLLLAESVVCLAITLWPHCLGISLDETRMVKVLQGNYGVPGKEQFTVAMDLAQSRFGCCGMNSDINYDTSMWKLQGYGQREWVVPLTCCVLENSAEPQAHLDPKPANETQCQALERDTHSQQRYTESCLGHLALWYREHYFVFLVASLVVAAVEFGVLLSIIVNCTRISAKTVKVESLLELRSRAKSRQMLVENIYEPELEGGGASRPRSSIRQLQDSMEDFKELYVQPRDLYKQRHNTTFKPVCSDYQRNQRGYFV